MHALLILFDVILILLKLNDFCRQSEARGPEGCPKGQIGAKGAQRGPKGLGRSRVRDGHQGGGADRSSEWAERHRRVRWGPEGARGEGGGGKETVLLPSDNLAPALVVQFYYHRFLCQRFHS